MDGEERNSGIDLIGYIPWGTHFCQFYETPEDLTSILVPYFKAGLENNEFCMWVTSEPLQVGEARAALKKAVTNLDDYTMKGQIEILDYSEWYTRSGKFDSDEVLKGWVEKENRALEKGSGGLRLTGNTFWLEKNDWKSFTEYEAELNKVIGNYRMIALCTYSLDRCGAAEVIDVVSNHQFVLVRRQGQWQLMKSTEHKQAEETLRRTEENFHRSLDDSPLGIRIMTADGEIIYANQAILDIYGYDSIEELRATPTKKRYTPESYAEHQIRKTKRQRGEYVPSNYEISIVRKDGEVRHLEVFRKEVLWNGKTQFQVLYNDVTERKQAEGKHQTILKTALDGFWLHDLEGRLLEVNDSYCKMIGYTQEELLTMSIPDVEAAESPEETARHIKKIVEQGYDHFETRHKRKDGKIIDIEISSNYIDVGGGQMFVFVRDITERKQAEEALERSEENYRRLFEEANDAIMIADTETGVILDANKQAERLLGRSRKEIIGMNRSQVHPPDKHEYYQQHFIKHVEAGRIVDYDAEAIRKDGTVVPVSISAGTIQIGDKKLV